MIRVIDIAGEKSADNDAADLFGEKFAPLVNEHKLTLDQIFNADDTGLY